MNEVRIGCLAISLVAHAQGDEKYLIALSQILEEKCPHFWAVWSPGKLKKLSVGNFSITI